MKITQEDLGNRQVMLTIELEPERIEGVLRGVARRVAKDYAIPGFRRGRAPYHVVLQRFGRETLLREAMDDLGREVFEEALSSENLDPYGPGDLEDLQLDPVTFKVRVPLRPVVDLGDYRELRVEPPPVTIEEEQVESELERLRQLNAVLEPAGDRPAQMGDWISYSATIATGEEVLSREETRTSVVEPEDKDFAPGFAEQIVGMRAGEQKQFSLALGTGWGEEKAGQEASFTVSLLEVRNRTVPELDDDLARTIGDFDTLEELRLDIRGQFEQEARREVDREYSMTVLDELASRASIAYPPDLIEDQIDGMTEDLKKSLEERGTAFEDYLKLSGQTEEAFRESLRSQAETIVRRGLVLGELAGKEQLDVEGTEVQQRIALLSANWGEHAAEVRDMLSEPDRMRSIANRLLTDKAVQRLVSIARGEAPPLEMAEEAAGEGSEPLTGGADALANDQNELGAQDAPSSSAESVPEDLERMLPAAIAAAPETD